MHTPEHSMLMAQLCALIDERARGVLWLALSGRLRQWGEEYSEVRRQIALLLEKERR